MVLLGVLERVDLERVDWQLWGLHGYHCLWRRVEDSIENTVLY